MKESAPTWFYKLGKHLIAGDEEAEQLIRPISQGEAFAVRIHRPRNLAHHRKYWALVNLVFQNQERYPSKNHLHIQIKIAAGWYDAHVAMDGTPIYVPKSISFDEMDQTEFENFYREACEAIVRLLPQFQLDWLLEQVVEFGS